MPTNSEDSEKAKMRNNLCNGRESRKPRWSGWSVMGAEDGNKRLSTDKEEP